MLLNSSQHPVNPSNIDMVLLCMQQEHKSPIQYIRYKIVSELYTVYLVVVYCSVKKPPVTVGKLNDVLMTNS